MIRDLNTKKTMKNAYRITKNKYQTSLRVRIQGGCVDPESLMIVSKIASEYGNGDIHITTRQGFEILGIKMEDMKTNKLGIKDFQNRYDSFLNHLQHSLNNLHCQFLFVVFEFE